MGYQKIKETKTLLIKFDESVPFHSNRPFQIIVKFKRDPYKEWMYHMPNKAFHSQDEILKYIRENQESKWLKVKIIGMHEGML